MGKEWLGAFRLVIDDDLARPVFSIRDCYWVCPGTPATSWPGPHPSLTVGLGGWVPQVGPCARVLLPRGSYPSTLLRTILPIPTSAIRGGNGGGSALQVGRGFYVPSPKLFIVLGTAALPYASPPH